MAPVSHVQEELPPAVVYGINRFMKTTDDLARIRFTTANFPSLQGLRQVALGAMLLIAIPIGGLENIWLFTLLIVLLGVVWWRIGAYYDHRFGRVAVPKLLWAWPGSDSLLKRTAFIAIVIVISAVAMKIFHLFILTPGWFLGIFFAGWTLEARRWYYLPFSAAFFALEILNRSHGVPLQLIEIWLTPFAFIITGIADHLLLVRSLPGVPANGNA